MKNIYKMKFVWLLCFFEGVGWWNLCYINLGGSGKKTGEHNANLYTYIYIHISYMGVISMFVLVDTPLTGAFAFLRLERRFDGRCSRRDGGRGALCAAPPPSEKICWICRSKGAAGTHLTSIFLWPWETNII